jgi:ABC-type transport system substrate-binding protein
MKGKKIFIWFSITLVLVFLIANIQAPKRGGELRIALPRDVGVLTPWGPLYGDLTKILINVYEQLTSPNWEGELVGPGIAASWDVEKEGKVFTFYLRKGVRFSNGEPLTADDVIASARLFHSAIPFKVEKVDQMTVRFTTDESTNIFPINLAHINFSVGPSFSVAEYKRLEKLDRVNEFNPIGTGAFKLQRRQKKGLVLAANDNYWKGSPYIERLSYRFIPESSDRVAALDRGEVDLIDSVFPEDLERLKRNPDLVVKSVYGLNICFLAMNNKRKPFTDVRVRRAIDLALNKLTLARNFVYGGYGIPTDRPLSPSFFGFPSLPAVGIYQPREAVRWLAEAGYPEGFSTRLLVIPASRPYLPDPKGGAEEIARQLSLVGIKAEIIVPRTVAEFLATIEEGDYDLQLSGWNGYVADPDFLLTAILGGPDIRGLMPNNYSSWENRDFDQKLLAARSLPLSDVWGRIKLYNEAVAIFKDERPFVPLFHTRVFAIYNRRVKGVRLSPNGMIIFSDVWLER